MADHDELLALANELDDIADYPGSMKIAQRVRGVAAALRAALAARPQPLSPSTLEAAINCVDACAADEREPERYRTWYAEAATELRALAGSATPTGDDDDRGRSRPMAGPGSDHRNGPPAE
jgi:hypothetical protein